MNLSFIFCTILLVSRAFATCGEGISPSFSLDTRPPQVQLVEPSNLDTLYCSEQCTISWLSINVTAVQVQVQRTPQGAWQTLYSNQAPIGSISWPVSAPESNLALLRVISTANPTIGDTVVVQILSRQTTGSIGGYVLDGISRDTFPGANVILTPGNRTVQTGQQGEFVFSNVPLGTYNLRISTDGRPDIFDEVNVGGNFNQYYFGTFEYVSLTVLQGNGSPLSKAKISFPGSGYQTLNSGQNGEALFQKVGNGQLTIQVEKRGYLTETFQLDSGEYSHTIRMNRNQNETPLYIFLIRGVDRACADEPDGDVWLWSELKSYIENVEFQNDNSVHVNLVQIRPSSSIESNADILRDTINSIVSENNADIILIGHSMGGVIAREYLANSNICMEGDKAEFVKRLFTIDSPHWGSKSALAGLLLNFFGHMNSLSPNFGDCNLDALANLNTVSMKNRNLLLLDNEFQSDVEYVLIGRSRCFDWGGDQLSYCNVYGDWVVNRDSQMLSSQWVVGLYGAPVHYEVKPPDKIKRRMFYYEDEEFFGDGHIWAPKISEIVEFIAENVDGDFSSIPIDESDNRSIDPDELSITHSSFHTILPDSFIREDILVEGINTLVMDIAADSSIFWSLMLPNGVLINSQDGIVNAGGQLLTNTSGSHLVISFATPQSGSWVLSLHPLSDFDTAYVHLQMLTDMPLIINPERGMESFSQTLGVKFAAKVTTVPGVAVDSVRVGDTNGNYWNLVDDGSQGDETAWDGVFTAWSGTSLPPGARYVRYEVNAHLQSTQYHALYDEIVDIHTDPLFQYLSTSMDTIRSNNPNLLSGVRADVQIVSNLSQHVSVSGDLHDSNDEFVCSGVIAQHLDMGQSTISLPFDGAEIAAARHNGPYKLNRLSISASPEDRLGYQSNYYNQAQTDTLFWEQFATRMPQIENLAAYRDGGNIHVSWASPNDAIDGYYLLFYDTNDEDPFDGTDLAEGPSPLTLPISVHSITLQQASPDSLYRFTISRVDALGNQSTLCPPYSVFSLQAPETVQELQIQWVTGGVQLSWQPVPDGAEYIVQTAATSSGPWTSAFSTFSTRQFVSVPDIESQRFFRVIAAR